MEVNRWRYRSTSIGLAGSTRWLTASSTRVRPDGDVIAVDGATGMVKWKWHPTTANSGFGPTGTRRGLSVGGGRVYTLAAGNRVVALNRNTGAQIWANLGWRSSAK